MRMFIYDNTNTSEIDISDTSEHSNGGYVARQTGAEFRTDIVWRSSYQTVGRWGIPLMRRQELVAGDINLISYADTRPNDKAENKVRGVHFFIDDPRFEGLYRHPENSLEKLAQYRFVLTPDYSLYAEMKPWMQLQSVAKSRWVGAYWQSKGLTVYPTLSWGTAQTFEFCFKGCEKGSTVAIATYACKAAKSQYLFGYYEMLRQLDPEHVICLGEPFPEMREVDVVVDHVKARKAMR